MNQCNRETVRQMDRQTENYCSTQRASVQCVVRRQAKLVASHIRTNSSFQRIPVDMQPQESASTKKQNINNKLTLLPKDLMV